MCACEIIQIIYYCSVQEIRAKRGQDSEDATNWKSENVCLHRLTYCYQLPRLRALVADVSPLRLHLESGIRWEYWKNSC